MIRTWSKFNFATNITAQNYLGDFQEGGAPVVATLDTKTYTLGEFVAAVQTALNSAGDNSYTVNLNRSTGLVTVAANDVFKILTTSGDNVGTDFWSTLGFTGSDRTGASTYTGNLRAGTAYYPQFLLQSYVGPTIYRQSLDPMINRTASGRTEMVRFGIEQFIEFEIKFITSLAMDGVVIKNNPSGLANAITFLNDITNKVRFEFVPDVGTPATFHKVILESCQGYKDGSGFKLKELFLQNLPDVYETGIMTLRVVS